MQVTERFLKYVSFDTTSSETSDTVPTTAHQKELGRYLADELARLGLENAHMDQLGYVYAVLPATPGQEHVPALGLISHMDTSPAVSGADIQPQIVTYQGGDLPLAKTGCLRVKDFPFLSRYVGQELIVTDGTTLLGADDKAGVAEIVTACEYLLAHPEIPHRTVAVCFTPDEEVGKGADHFDPAKFPAKAAYTVDGGELGEIEYENFNAAAVTLTVHGVNIHPGSAKDKMKNAVLMAHQFISLLPEAETPAHTEGYEGFYHVTDVSGNETEVVLHAIIRDHDREKFEARKTFVENAVRYLNGVWGDGSFQLELKDSYYNMKEKLLPHMELIDNACAAMRAVGVEPEIVPIRGGTDGARLSWERDIPAPTSAPAAPISTASMSLSPWPPWRRWCRCWWSWSAADPAHVPPERPSPCERGALREIAVKPLCKKRQKNVNSSCNLP